MRQISSRVTPRWFVAQHHENNAHNSNKLWGNDNCFNNSSISWS